jgi:uncharacterized membrane protein
VTSPIEFWPCFAGLVFLVLGLIFVRRELAAASGLDKLIALGPVFVAAPLAVFGAEHLAGARVLMGVVPSWIPGRLFWTYFVGFALLAAALSFVVMRFVRWSSLLFAAMIFLFVLLIHVPNVITHPKERIYWVVMLRDLAFGAGGLAYFGTFRGKVDRVSRAVVVARVCIAVAVVFFGIEYFLHPEVAWGVPLAKLTPAWVPFPFFWAWLDGAVLLVAGLCLLIDKRSRVAATLVGLVMVVVTVVLYTPILAMASGAGQVVEGFNYVADTLLFGGTTLLLAAALPQDTLLSR